MRQQCRAIEEILGLRERFLQRSSSDTSNDRKTSYSKHLPGFFCQSQKSRSPALSAAEDVEKAIPLHDAQRRRETALGAETEFRDKAWHKRGKALFLNLGNRHGNAAMGGG